MYYFREPIGPITEITVCVCIKRAILVQLCLYGEPIGENLDFRTLLVSHDISVVQLLCLAADISGGTKIGTIAYFCLYLLNTLTKSNKFWHT